MTTFPFSVTAKNYPVALQDNVIEDYHGTPVADPYRWLEDPASEETQAWGTAQNILTQEFLGKIPQRKHIQARLKELWDYPRYSVPSKEGHAYFFSKNDGLQNQAVLYTQQDLASKPVVALDPNQLSIDGTVALTNQAISRNGKLLAYGLSKSGSDWQDIKIRDLATSQDYPETIQWSKFSDIAWKHDNSGFYYSRFPEPGSVSKEDESNYNKVYWHQLDTTQAQDKLIHEQPEAKGLAFSPTITEDGRYITLNVWEGTNPKNRFYYREITSEQPFIRLLNQADARYDLIDNIGSILYFQTDFKAPRNRVIAIDLAHPEVHNWREIIAQTEDTISSVLTVNNYLAVTYMHDAHELVKLYDLNGKFIREIQLPTIGSVTGISGKRTEQEMFLGFTSFLYPTTIFRYDFTTDQLIALRPSENKFDHSGYETKQIFYPSKDGTKIPMFITHKKGLKLNGQNPTLLYGYGGFNISLTPSFSPSRLVWLENGGIYAIANLRGGGEYGEAWHQAGMLGNKQNVFDDFAAAATWLITHQYTSAPQLAINGGSNGGLLVAATMLQHPELFGAVVCQVPVTDMLRYHRFTVGRYWIPEYGNAQANAADFKFMYDYSPVHNVKAGVTYPAILVTTADTDDRVVPAHAKKFTAMLQAKAEAVHPVLIRIETKAGHGSGKPTAKVIEEQSDIYAFLFKTLAVK